MVDETLVLWPKDERAAFSVLLFDMVGGHAGLTAQLLHRCTLANTNGFEDAKAVALAAANDFLRLFQHWLLRFSRPARLVLDEMANSVEGLLASDIGQVLEAHGLDRFEAPRVWNELQYVGVAHAAGGMLEDTRLTKVNRIFWNYYTSFTSWPGQTVDASVDMVWGAIGRAEVALRKLVYEKYESRWPRRGLERMRSVLGEEAWVGLEEVREKAEAKYPFSPEYERTIMDCMYLGQLGTLVENRKAWSLFLPCFGDKALLQRWLKEISPVRNDIAHFSPSVPEKELRRCRLACDDLLVVIEQGNG